jgi:BirA family transcriptional regulator, biotin operon repressor / biotin---[acetyl-CoA-carboxylase] ligase
METLFVGRNMIFLPEVDSTNSYAINLLKNVKVSEGTVIHSGNQTKGKGQRGNVWNTEPNSNVTASVILKPDFLDIKKQFFLYQIAALACYDVMAETLNSGQYDIKIKWPNDILVSGKKIAGILIENMIANNVVANSVMGIGINVKQCEFDNKLNATSLQLLAGKGFEPGAVLDILCSKVEKYYLMLKNNKLSRISELYLSHFYMKDRWQNFEIANRKAKMKIVGTSDTGLLQLEDEFGNVKDYDVKELIWLNN